MQREMVQALRSGWGVIPFCRFGFVQISGSDAPCPRHFKTPTSALTGKSCLLVCCFAQGLWPSASLQENNPTMITSFGFAMQAHRCQLAIAQKKSRSKVAPRLKSCCSSLPMVKKPWHVERVSDDSCYAQDANGVKPPLYTAAHLCPRAALSDFPQPAFCRLSILILGGS
jgi:hypothetical protein